jgi:hypothetical protein
MAHGRSNQHCYDLGIQIKAQAPSTSHPCALASSSLMEKKMRKWKVTVCCSLPGKVPQISCTQCLYSLAIGAAIFHGKRGIPLVLVELSPASTKMLCAQAWAPAARPLWVLIWHSSSNPFFVGEPKILELLCLWLRRWLAGMGGSPSWVSWRRIRLAVN